MVVPLSQLDSCFFSKPISCDLNSPFCCRILESVLYKYIPRSYFPLPHNFHITTSIPPSTHLSLPSLPSSFIITTPTTTITTTPTTTTTTSPTPTAYNHNRVQPSPEQLSYLRTRTAFRMPATTAQSEAKTAAPETQPTGPGGQPSKAVPACPPPRPKPARPAAAKAPVAKRRKKTKKQRTIDAAIKKAKPGQPIKTPYGMFIRRADGKVFAY